MDRNALDVYLTLAFVIGMLVFAFLLFPGK